MRECFNNWYHTLSAGFKLMWMIVQSTTLDVSNHFFPGQQKESRTASMSYHEPFQTTFGRNLQHPLFLHHIQWSLKVLDQFPSHHNFRVPLKRVDQVSIEIIDPLCVIRSKVHAFDLVTKAHIIFFHIIDEYHLRMKVFIYKKFEKPFFYIIIYENLRIKHVLIWKLNVGGCIFLFAHDFVCFKGMILVWAIIILWKWMVVS